MIWPIFARFPYSTISFQKACRLTGEPVFAGNDRQDLLRQIAFDEPRQLRRYNKAMPAELEERLLDAFRGWRRE